MRLYLPVYVCVNIWAHVYICIHILFKFSSKIDGDICINLCCFHGPPITPPPHPTSPLLRSPSPLTVLPSPSSHRVAPLKWRLREGCSPAWSSLNVLFPICVPSPVASELPREKRQKVWSLQNVCF